MKETVTGVKKTFLLCLAALIPGAYSAKAVPILQLYAEGAVYDATTETWVSQISAGGVIRLWTIGNVNGPGGAGTISNVRLSVAYDIGDTPSISLASSTTAGYNGVADPSTPVTPTYLQTRTDGSVPLLSDGASLPSHGEYGAGTAWQEFALGNFSLKDSPIGDFINSFPTIWTANSGQINVYEITVTGTDQVHFDLYDGVQAGKKVKTVFAPFSHDAEGGGNRVPDGGSTMLLLSGGLFGLRLLQQRLKKA